MPEADTLKIDRLQTQLRTAQGHFFGNRDPGNLTPAAKQAFQYRDMAYLLLLKAAQMELEAEVELQVLLKTEAA